MNFRAWLEKQAPDFLVTGQRFPFAILFAALTTIVVIGNINDLYWFGGDIWERTVLGLATGAVLAVAGVYFAESRPEARAAGLVLKYVVPVAVAAAFQITDINWFVPHAMPAVAILWLSVAPFTRIERGAPREEAQNRFWWVNFQAFATAVIAAAAFLIIALGLAAIERSLAILFGLETGQVFYNWVLPFTGLFLTPVYWLSTLPRLSAYRAEELEKPDFLPRAFGFLGQFVLVPLLLIYGLILLAYTAQIVVTQKLPEGMIGWMVLGFVTIGAATWLVLHPPFMRTRALVRLFRSWWFWLTLIPLGLFFIAVWTRVDAYGLTGERVLLAAGGLWAAILAFAHLAGRGDIRLIPALAGGILLVTSVGPWNYANLPVAQQTMRLDALLSQPGKNGASFPPDWTNEQRDQAASIISFLLYSPGGRERLTAALSPYGVTPEGRDTSSILSELGQAPPPVAATLNWLTARRDPWRDQIDLAATPILIGAVSLFPGNESRFPGLSFDLTGTQLRVRDLSVWTDVDLTDWLSRQGEGALVDPWIDFTVGERRFRLVVEELDVTLNSATAPRVPASMRGTLFASSPMPIP